MVEKVLSVIWPDILFQEGENLVICPFHGDNIPSAHIKLEGNSVLFHCKVCDEGMGLLNLISKYYNIDDKNSTIVINALKEGKEIYEWTPYVDKFINTPKAAELLSQFNIYPDVMTKLNIGFTGAGVSFPVTVGNVLVDVRTYNPSSQPKVRSIPGASIGWVLPEFAFNKKTIVLVEGEKDMAVLQSLGISGAATITGGAMAVPNKTTSMFDYKDVYIVYDNDDAGKKGAQKVANFLIKNSKANVYIGDIAPVVNNENKADITDYVNKYGGNLPHFVENVLREAKMAIYRPLDKPKGPVYNKVMLHEAGTMVGQMLESVIQISATTDVSFTIPSSALINDSATWKPDIDNMSSILNLVDSGVVKEEKAIFESFTGVEYDKDEDTVIVSNIRIPVYKVVITSTVKDSNKKGYIQTEYQAFSFTPFESGKIYKINYEITNDVKKGNRSVVLIHKADDMSASGSKFSITDNVKKSLDVINKFTLPELIEKQKGVINANFNNKLITAIELSMHSALEFNLGRYKGIKGTVDSIIVTDTGFGKSVTSTALLKAYGVGSRVSLAGSAATPTGLIGGSKPVGNGYQTTAGVIPRNHKGFIAFEELAKNNGSVMKDLTDIRTSGVAEITRVAGKLSLPANVRMAFFSNPKAGSDGTNKTVDVYPNGIEIIQDLLGAREDIGRFDLISILGQRESIEDDPSWIPMEPIPIEHLRNRINWVWSRTAEDIHYEDGVIAYIVGEKTKELNSKYESDVQIFGRKTWMKLAKVSIAIAGYEGSHTEDYEGILVKKEHVDRAIELFKELYSNDTFRLEHFVKEEKSYVNITEGSTNVLKGIYNSSNGIVSQLAIVSEIQTRELQTVSGLSAEDFNQVISDLTRHKLIRNIRAKIIPTEKFRKTLEYVENEPSMFPDTVDEEGL